MPVVVVLFHGLALFSANLCSLVLGFYAYRFSGSGRQIMVQGPIAALISISLFVFWTILLNAKALKRFRLGSARAFAGAYAASFVWLPIIFVPVHYVTQGYLTAFSNIVAVWVFQAPVNAAAVLVAMAVASRNGGEQSV